MTMKMKKMKKNENVGIDFGIYVVVNIVNAVIVDVVIKKQMLYNRIRKHYNKKFMFMMFCDI